LNSEYYYDLIETAKFNQVNLSLWGEKNHKTQRSTGINFSSKEIKKNFPGFSRNFVDQDGEGLEPWYPSAKINELSLAHWQTIPLTDPRFDINIDLFDGLLFHDPTKKQFNNSVYFEDIFTTFTPLYVTEWESNKFTTGLLENTVGIKYSTDPLRKFLWQVNFDLTFDGILLDEKSIAKPNYQFDLQGEFRLHKRHILKAQVGRRRIPFHFDQVRFISNHFLSGQQFFWRDLNNDRNYQTNEQLGLFKTTGGKYHLLSSDLKQPSINYLDLSWEWNIGKKWNFYVINQYRAFIIRMLWGYKFNFPLRMAFQMLWKDGQPINLFESALLRNVSGNQVAFWNENIKGINPFTGQFGFRESAYFNFEFRFKYQASLKDHPLNFNLNIYNIFDLGTTLSNFSFSPGPSPAQRFVLDVQIPRGVIIGVDYSF